MNQNKPFDLQAALAGASVVNGDGTEVFITKLVRPNTNGTILVSQDAEGRIQAYHFLTGGSDTDSDSFRLYMAPVEKMVWINVYPVINDAIGNRHWSGIHETESMADYAAGPRAVKRVGGKAHMITYTE
jgi:hypothetical protein